AFASGRAVLRSVRAAPRGARVFCVPCSACGLAFLALGTLLCATFGLLRPWTPWAVDAIALVVGASGLRVAAERVLEPWRMSELAIIVGSRIPLLVVLSLAALAYLAVPLLPPSTETGVDALALPVQAE